MVAQLGEQGEDGDEKPKRSSLPRGLKPEDVTLEKALAWARGNGLRYGLTGSVDEWRYKVGVDGEPAVGVSLQLLDITTGAVVWTATGSKSGWSREALSAVAHKLLDELSRPLATVPRSAR